MTLSLRLALADAAVMVTACHVIKRMFAVGLYGYDLAKMSGFFIFKRT